MADSSLCEASIAEEIKSASGLRSQTKTQITDF